MFSAIGWKAGREMMHSDAQAPVFSKLSHRVRKGGGQWKVGRVQSSPGDGGDSRF